MSSRQYHLDTLRSFCMLFGVFVHTNTLGDFGFLELAGLISDHFRMASFFVVSGILGALVLERRATGVYIRGRVVNLGIPLLVGLFFLNPITLWLIFVYHNSNEVMPTSNLFEIFFVDNERYQGPLVWHLHLWFLISLLVMAALAPIASYVLKAPAVKKSLANGLQFLPTWLHGTALATVTVAFVLILRIINEVVAPDLNEIWLVRATLNYIPFFVVGIAIFTQSPLWEAVNRIDPLLIAMAILAILVSLFIPKTLPETYANFFDFVILNFVRSAAAFSLIAIFLIISKNRNIIVDLITRSIYTVYIFHFLYIYIVALFVNKYFYAENIYSYLFICASSIFLGLFTHFFIIEKFSVLKFLFNGK